MSVPAPLSPPRRVLMGPGPSDVDARVLQAMALPTIGHLDPAFLRIMDEVSAMLREVLGTANRLTMPLSGTGSAGMEALLVNLVEPGDRVVIGVNGVFGTRMVEVAKRAGAEVVAVQGEWGRALDPAALRAAVGGQRTKLLAVVHAETSTGARQDLAPLRAIADEGGALLCADTVTSIAGIPVGMDAHGVDAVYAGTQKCLSAPPGLAPFSVSERALAAIKGRARPVQSWYLDVNLLGAYWADGATTRAYHHTAPINAVYALHEALRLALAEGLAARFERHARLGAMLQSGLDGLGLELLVPAAERLPQLTSVRVPAGIDEAALRRRLLSRWSLEIGGGLGPLAGKVWRIGLMGAACNEANVALCLAAFEDALRAQRG